MWWDVQVVIRQIFFGRSWLAYWEKWDKNCEFWVQTFLREKTIRANSTWSRSGQHMNHITGWILLFPHKVAFIFALSFILIRNCYSQSSRNNVTTRHRNRTSSFFISLASRKRRNIRDGFMRQGCSSHFLQLLSWGRFDSFHEVPRVCKRERERAGSLYFPPSTVWLEAITQLKAGQCSSDRLQNQLEKNMR